MECLKAIVWDMEGAKYDIIKTKCLGTYFFTFFQVVKSFCMRFMWFNGLSVRFKGYNIAFFTGLREVEYRIVKYLFVEQTFPCTIIFEHSLNFHFQNNKISILLILNEIYKF